MLIDLFLFAHQIKYSCRRQTLKMNAIKLSETTLCVWVCICIFKVLFNALQAADVGLLLSLNECNKNDSKVAEIEEENE